MSVLNQSGEEQVECPLCMEPLEVDDLNFFPCTCGYQICRFCWHRIRTDENGLCPACRKGYPENPADFKPLSQEEVAKLKAEKRHKDQQRKQKITENRKHLANVRVVQRNLVFVVGLPMRLADSEVLKKHEYFGKFGKIHKVVINQCTSYAGTQGPSASAYVTYQRSDDALRAIQAVNNISVDGRSIKSSLGTTKYCSHFMKNQACPKPDCMYLHEQGDTEASFTKEEMQQGKHQEYEKKLHDALISASAGARDRKPTPPLPVATVQAAQVANKEAWPSLQPGAPLPPNGCPKSSESRRKSLPPPTPPPVAPASPSTPSTASSPSSSSPPLDFSEEDSCCSESDEIPQPVSAAQPLAPVARLTLFEPDNNSFFSSNSFTKVAAAAGQPNTLTGDWQVAQSHMPDMMLPTAHPSEDWQAAFSGLHSSDRPFNSVHSQASAFCQPQRHSNAASKLFNAYHQVRHGDAPEEEAEEEFYQKTTAAERLGGFGYGDGKTAGEEVISDDCVDWGFDLFQETQKGLAEMMEKETTVTNHKAGQGGHCFPGGYHPITSSYPQQAQNPFQASKLMSAFSQQQQPNIHAQQNHRAVSGCSRLLDGLGLGPSTTRSRLPPPGFSAPNHSMNAFGLGIPRAPTQTQNMLYQNTNTFNGMKDWSENLRGLIPFAPPPSSPPHNSSLYATQQQQQNAAKGWTGPCSDWTALDPAIVSSSRPPAPPHLQQQQQQHSTAHWLRHHLEERQCLTPGDWATQPPPGFTMRQQSTAGVGDL